MLELIKTYLQDLDLAGYDPALVARSTGVTLEVAKEFVNPARRYMVESNSDYGFLAGATGDGKPALLFVGIPRLAADDSQETLNIVTFDLATAKVTHIAVPVDDSSWDDILDAAEEAVGFQHIGNCPVLSFKHPTLWHYAVVPFPFHLHEEAIGEVESDGGAREWMEAGNFVLHCGNDYFMSAEGAVESS